MTISAIIGAQWGDEGKGKITDKLASHSDFIVRYQGGDNAGHTIYIDNQKLVLHQVPSGILYDHTQSIISHGVVLNPRSLCEEIDQIKAIKSFKDNALKISDHATVITSYHKLLDACREQKKKDKIGTTCKGIGPAYESKIQRHALKFSDLSNPNLIESKLNLYLEEKSVLFENLYSLSKFPSAKEEAQELHDCWKQLKQYQARTFPILGDAIAQNKNVLFEGAQGVLLDIDYGTYPYVTSSSPSSAGIYSGASTYGKMIDHNIGITKAYITRVGEGPMPTEQLNSVGETLGRAGHEFGATTGRKRRCGHLDLPLLKYASLSSGLTEIALTKLDVLQAIESIEICTHYDYLGEKIDCAFPGIDLSKAKPIYKSLKMFKDDLSGSLTKEQFSLELNVFLSEISEHIHLPVSLLSYGPGRDEIISL